MSAQYVAVSWTRQKRIYDLTIAGCVTLYLGAFITIGAFVHPAATIETLFIRAFGTAAFLTLNFILAIGPLARLDSRFLPLLYNRRHLGVTMFCLAFAHAAFSVFQFHALGDVNPFASLFISNTRFGSIVNFPFEVLGFVALTILFLMAATSHDFWLNLLSASVWKRIHMLVYAAYALLVAHVALGALQSETSPWIVGLVLTSFALICVLHILSGWRECRVDRELIRAESGGFVDIGVVDQIPESRALIATVGNERVAVFRYDGKISAISNVCRHQGGPLGEGRIVDGCVTCPWHGYQYRPECGASPPPFTEKVATYRTRVVGDRVLVHPAALPPGTHVEPSLISQIAEQAI
jgi:nitrite reductase/ring-hydroxylating ferredoxin subunit/DMSO/TMAO reductase YedYZ heme-binding membrane subunit